MDKVATVKPEVKEFFASIESFVSTFCSADAERAEMYRSISAFCKAHSDLLTMPLDYDKIIESINNYLKIYE